jgi:hypothetical protein
MQLHDRKMELLHSRLSSHEANAERQLRLGVRAMHVRHGLGLGMRMRRRRLVL